VTPGATIGVSTHGEKGANTHLEANHLPKMRVSLPYPGPSPDEEGCVRIDAPYASLVKAIEDCGWALVRPWKTTLVSGRTCSRLDATRLDCPGGEEISHLEMSGSLP